MRRKLSRSVWTLAFGPALLAGAITFGSGLPDAHADARLGELIEAARTAERKDSMSSAIRRAEEALRYSERKYGRSHNETERVVEMLARLYRLAGRTAQASQMEQRLRQMQAAESQRPKPSEREVAAEPRRPRAFVPEPTAPATAPGAALPSAKKAAPVEPPASSPRTVTALPPPSASARPPAPAAPPSPMVSAAPPIPPAAPAPVAAQPAPAPATAALDPARFAQVPVFFGTNRARGKDATRAGAGTLATFSSTPAVDLQLGAAVVSVPRQGREQGEIPRPRAASFWRAAEKEDPNFHFMLLSVDPLTRALFIEQVDKRLAASQGAFKDQAFVFVHGFNVSFEDAVYRTAQISYDLEFSGAPFLYSWPTLEGAFGYVGARDRALASRSALREFLDLVSQKTSAKRIHLIAHSMGTWPLLDVLREIAATDAGKAEPRFREVILVAPDMDRDNFATLAARVCPQRSGSRCSGGAADGVTFFATSKDRALLASLTLSSGIDRAGLFDEKRPFVVKNIDTIDVSAADTSVFSYNHSQPLERVQLLRDIGALLANGVRPPHTRTPAYAPRTTTAGEAYWTYQQRP